MASKHTPTIRLRDSNKYGMDGATLFGAVKALAQEAARVRVESSDFSDLTDSTGGTYTAGSLLVAMAVPAAFVHVSGNDLAPKAGFDTAIGKILNVEVSLADHLNKILATLGLDKTLTFSGGSISTTLNALDKTLTGVDGSGGTGVGATDGIDRCNKIVRNMGRIVNALNMVLTAVGNTRVTFPNAVDTAGAIELLASTGAGVTGAASATASLSDTVVDTFLTAVADNYARIAFFLNELSGTALADLTDNSGGSASDTVAALTAPTAHTVSGSDAASQSDLAAVLIVIENNQTDLAARYNAIARRLGLDLIDFVPTGATPDATLASQAASVNGVDGSGNSAAPVSGLSAIVTAFKNNYATLIAKVNEAAVAWGLTALTDNTGGTAGTALANIAALGAGVDGTSSTTVTKAATDTLLAAARNATASIAAKLNAMTAAKTRPLAVVVTP